MGWRKQLDKRQDSFVHVTVFKVVSKFPLSFLVFMMMIIIVLIIKVKLTIYNTHKR